MSIKSILVNYGFKKSDDRRDKGLTTPDDIKRVDHLYYGQNKKWQVLDVYYPKDTNQPLPVIINIHGGGWVYGTKETYQFYCMSLAQRHFVVVNMSYRLAPKHKFPKQLEDINLVIGWIHQHDNEYHMDLNHVYLIGDSAGAHLATLYTSFCVNKAYQTQFSFKPISSFKPNAIVLNCGIYDIYDINTRLKTLLKDLLGRKGYKNHLKLVQPIDHITHDFPPVYVMTSNEDFLREQAPILVSQLKEKKIDFQYKIYGEKDNKLSHVFHCDIRKPEAKICNDDECRFLRKY